MLIFCLHYATISIDILRSKMSSVIDEPTELTWRGEQQPKNLVTHPLIDNISCIFDMITFTIILFFHICVIG